MKRSGEQLDDRIVEVHWDPVKEQWRFMRFRDDKPAGNFKTVVENIIKSIADGVEKEQVIHTASHVESECPTDRAPSSSHDPRPSATPGKHATPIRNNVRTGRPRPPPPGHRRKPTIPPVNRRTGTHRDAQTGPRPSRGMGPSRSRRGARSPARRWSLGCTDDGRAGGHRGPCARRSRLPSNVALYGPTQSFTGHGRRYGVEGTYVCGPAGT